MCRKSGRNENNGGNKETKSRDIMNLDDDPLFEGVSGGNASEHHPMPLYGIDPMPKYGVANPRCDSENPEDKDTSADKTKN